MSNLTYKDVREQSKAVFKQFGESKWKPHAKINTALDSRDCNELRGVGLGKFMVLAAMGASLEDNIETIKKYRNRFDVLTCDKGFGALLEQGIKADYVILCDASILYDKWLKKWVEETKDVKLISTIYANPDWTTNWKGPKYFYINRDALESEKIFLGIVQEPRYLPITLKTNDEKNVFENIYYKLENKNIRVIPAGSNVSNAMVVFCVGCDDKTKDNFFGYEAYFLIGYDYSWKYGGNYYAWANPTPKRYYMHHRTVLDIEHNPCYTSENLLFSAKWLWQYIQAFNLPVWNCSERGLLDIPLKAKLEKIILNINVEQSARKRIFDSLNLLKKSKEMYDQAKKVFLESKEGLWL